jgi:methylmalonyl-CoA mutase
MVGMQLKFAGDFPVPTQEEWRGAVEKTLKGAPFDKKMLTRTYEGITLQPIYTRQDWPADGDPSGYPGAEPFTRGGTAAGAAFGGWDVRQLYTDPDPKDANDVVLHELERGVTSLWLRFDRAARMGLDGDAPEAEGIAGSDGIMVYSVVDLDLLLTGVYLDLVSIALDAGPQFLPAAGLLSALWARREVAPDKARGAFNADPLGALAATGSLPMPLDQALARVADLARFTAETYPHVTAVGVDTSPYHNAGATETVDLAAALATGVAYLRAMTAAGMSVDAACRQILFTLPVGCDQFLGICKLRAARKLWARVTEACGASEPARAMRLHATTAERILSQRDPWVNMLRTTVMCFASAVGGADSITVLPFNSALGLPDELGRRVARNTHVVLGEESSLSKVVDAGGGSWYVESRTDELARIAWREFQDIERQGGIAAVLKDGSLAAKIAATVAERDKNLARRRDPITGVSEFPNLAETMPNCRQPDLAAARAGARDRLATTRGKGGAAATALRSAPAGALSAAVVDAAAAGATIGAMAAALSGTPVSINSLQARRLTAPFEALRDASDAHLRKTGARPKIFLANLGPIAKHTARATFAKNFFEVGGVQAIPGDGFNDAGACAEAFKKSGAAVAILCSADPVYEEMVATVAPALKSAGCRFLYLAGNPGDHKDAYSKAGVDDYIFLGCDVLQMLRSTHAHLGVSPS